MPDPVLLRTFLAVAQSLSFTQAATRLELSQPTVSQQVRRLEESVGRPLFVRDTHGVRLTQDGEAMAGFARGILAAHEQATAYFRGSALRGRLRLGVSDDLALTRVPRVLREFRQQNPQIDLELTVAPSGALHRRLGARQLDLIFAKNEPGDARGNLVRRDRLVWVGPDQAALDPDRPVPLVTYHPPSITRAAALGGLERSGRTWRITCNSREVNGHPGRHPGRSRHHRAGREPGARRPGAAAGSARTPADRRRRHRPARSARVRPRSPYRPSPTRSWTARACGSGPAESRR